MVLLFCKQGGILDVYRENVVNTGRLKNFLPSSKFTDPRLSSKQENVHTAFYICLVLRYDFRARTSVKDKRNVQRCTTQWSISENTSYLLKLGVKLENEEFVEFKQLIGTHRTI